MKFAAWIRKRLAQLQGQPPVIQEVVGVSGQLSTAEALLLYRLAQNAQKGCIIEVGSYHGRSTVALAHGSRDGFQAPVFAIEPHEVFEGVLGGVFGPHDRAAFFRTMLRTKAYEYVRLVNLSSEVVAAGWKQPVALLWIDGDHRYEAVQRDFLCWEPFLSTQAQIAFHDSRTAELGPARYIGELLAQGTYIQLHQVDTITVLQKSNGA